MSNYGTSYEATKQFLREYAERTLQRSKNGFYCCPLCGSGSHGHRGSDGALSITKDGQRWKCFSCNRGGDLIDLIEAAENITTEAARQRALDISGQTGGSWAARPVKRQEPQQPPKPEPQADFSAFIEECAANITLTDYPQRRGLSAETVERYKLGYYTGQGKAKEIITGLLGRDIIAPALIIPYNRRCSYFIARSTIETEAERERIAAAGIGKANFNGKQKHDKPPTEKAGREPIYNAAALYNAEGKPVFITEAPLDCLAYLDLGFYAVAIGGTGHEKLIEQLKRRPTRNRLIIALDNDQAGQEAAARLAEKLKKAGYSPKMFSYEQKG